MEYDLVVGLEVHVQLKTKTKLFSTASTQFGQSPNHNVAPLCIGLPGTLPVLNKHAVELAVRAGLTIVRLRTLLFFHEKLFLSRFTKRVSD